MRLLPVAISIALGSVLGPRLVERIGTTAVVAGGLAIFAAGLGWASTVDAGTPYLEIAMQMLLLGGGLGLTFSPATEAIMGSLSADKAGVGSGVNDTTRELGGTLGVAIVGSVFASIYSGRLGSDAVITALPGEVRSTMERSIAAAHEVIGQLPAGIGGVRDAVDNAFLDGLQVGSLVCAAIALGAAVVVAVLLPARARQTTEQPQPHTGRCVKGKDMPTEQGSRHNYTADVEQGPGTVKFFTRSDGSRLRYFTAGTGPPLVLLHTVRTQLDYFQRVIPLVWESYTVYALDLPGMGWSDIVPGARYEEPDLRAAVVDFVTGLDLYDVTLAGESLGAALSISTSIDVNDRVRRVVAFNSYDYPSGLERGNWFARFIITSVRMPGLGPVFAEMENRPILRGVMGGGFADRTQPRRRLARRASSQRQPSGLPDCGSRDLSQPARIHRGSTSVSGRQSAGDAGL